MSKNMYETFMVIMEARSNLVSPHLKMTPPNFQKILRPSLKL